MLSSDSTSSCAHAEALRDYAFDELPADERRAMEQHLAACGVCVMELDQLRLTAAALRTLPDRQIPQRIAFVSDQVFEPSAWRRFWNSGARLGFASACVLAAALVVSAWHYRPAAEIRTVVQAESPIKGASQAASASEIDAAVAKAVAQVRAEDAQMIQAAVQESGRKRDEEYRNQMIVIGENFDRLQKRLNLSYATMASNDLTGTRSRPVKPLLLIAAATLCFANTEPRVSRASIVAVEKSIDGTFAGYSGDPYVVYGNARGTYLGGYGALFTVELDLVNASSITPNPFKQNDPTPQEIATTRERKLKKLAILRESMRSLMVNAAGTLEGLPPNERVAMEAVLFYNSWEESRGLPRRLFMSAEKQKLLAARTGHAGQTELAAIIEEQER